MITKDVFHEKLHRGVAFMRGVLTLGVTFMRGSTVLSRNRAFHENFDLRKSVAEHNVSQSIN